MRWEAETLAGLLLEIKGDFPQPKETLEGTLPVPSCSIWSGTASREYGFRWMIIRRNKGPDMVRPQWIVSGLCRLMPFRTIS